MYFVGMMGSPVYGKSHSRTQEGGVRRPRGLEVQEHVVTVIVSTV